MAGVTNSANLIWQIAELLRGDYKQSEYGRVIQPLVVMRRLDQMMEPTRDIVVAEARRRTAKGMRPESLEQVLTITAGQPFFNRSPLRLHQLLDDPPRLRDNLIVYLHGFSRLAQQVVENFGFEAQIDRLESSDLLYPVLARVCDVDLHPDRISNLEMGYLFEELIRRFAEQSNETAGEHFTPREVVRLMVELLMAGDEDALASRGTIRDVFDCACGTGGMLSEAAAHIRALNEQAEVHLYGQELNGESYAICLSDMLVKGADAQNIRHGNSLSNDGHAAARFHYGIANPPFGVDWSKVERPVRDEHDELGWAGRFGPGLPRRSDGQLLFLLHLVSKMRAPEEDGGRVAIVLNGSPLFSGGPGSGESEIRRWLIESDLLEAIIALPDQLFYNTGIATYVWLLTNRKTPERRGTVQLIDARASWQKMRRSLGEKRREISEEQIGDIVRLHGMTTDAERVRIVRNEELGYRTVVVDQPLRARWEITEASFIGVEDDRAVAKLDRAQALAAGLRNLEPRVFASEGELRSALRATAVGTGITKPSASLLMALAARGLVRDADAPVLKGANGEPLADPAKRDTETLALHEDVERFLDREVRPHVPGAWVDDPEGRIGYEIPFTRLFYRYEPPRSSETIKIELEALEREIHQALTDVLRP
jgi:type I restriction enzyme M protein